MSAAVQRVRRNRLSDQAVAELKRLIATGVYTGGSRLPSEPELAEQLGVTRLTVREALANLEATGFTQTRHGSGTYVVDTAEVPTLGLLSELLGAGRRLAPEECLSLMEFRAVVVLGFVDAIVQHTSAEDLAALATLLERERTVLDRPGRSADELAGLDYQLNLVLARASRNLFYGLMMRSVRAVHLELGRIIFEKNQNDETIFTLHEEIVSSLRSRRVQPLRKSLTVYLEGGTKLIREWAKSRPTGAPRLVGAEPPRGRRPRIR